MQSMTSSSAPRTSSESSVLFSLGAVVEVVQLKLLTQIFRVQDFSFFLHP